MLLIDLISMWKLIKANSDQQRLLTVPSTYKMALNFYWIKLSFSLKIHTDYQLFIKIYNNSFQKFFHTVPFETQLGLFC